MQHKHLKLYIVLLLSLTLTGLKAQNIHESISASGGEAAGTGGVVSFSLGQVFYTTNSGSNGSIAQGVQQPFEISEVTGIASDKMISLICTAYPNPSTTNLQLRIENVNTENLSYQLLDMNGRILENKKIANTESNIVMSNLAPATYFLKVLFNNKEQKTFKIIKN